MKITIHQPEHMPWLGLFHKIAQVDICVLLDDVQYRKRYFQSKNKVRTQDGFNWIVVPVNSKRETLINEVMIANEPKWQNKWQKTLTYSYNKSKYGNLYIGDLCNILENDYIKLADLNIELIKYICSCLGIKTKFVLSSEIKTEGKASSKILNICKKMNTNIYLSGISGKDYLDLTEFNNNGIKVEFQEFHHPIYQQMYKPFIPCMSVIDLLCNYGKESLDTIFGKNVEVMNELFE